MSSEIRASSALTSSVTSSGSSELTIQNPLFSIGNQDSFPQLFKQQMDVRQDVQQAQNARRDAVERRMSEERRDSRANDRQDSGKPLPARADARASDTRAQGDVKRSDQTHQARAERDQADRDDCCESTPDAVAGEQVNGQAESTSGNVTEDVSASEAPVLPADPAPVTAEQAESADDAQAVALEELALLQAQAEQEAADADQLVDIDVEASLAADPDQALLSMSDDPGLVDSTNVVDEEEVFPSVDDQDDDTLSDTAGQVLDGRSLLDTAPQLTESSVVATAPAPVVGTVSSDTGGNQSLDTGGAGSAVETLTTELKSMAAEMSESSGEGDSQSPDAELMSGKLGAEPTQAEKNAEKNAEFSKLLAASGNRDNPMKEQLAALAQQLNGRSTQSEKTNTVKTEGTTDIKPTAFGRSLEQLSTTRTEAGKPLSTGIQTPVNSREWAGELGQRLVMMVSSKLKAAEIHLNPKDLGPVEVRIRMHEDKAHVVFSSQIAQTREALEQAVPRLREMLDQNGVALGNVDVQDHGAQHSHRQEQGGEGGRRQDGSGLEVDDEGLVSDNVSTRMVGLVDYYA